MGAVMPSGKLLARTMAHYVDVNSDAPVVELGPGTGAITSALVERGVDQKRLVLVEYNPGFCALLRDRYPQAKVVQGDAYRLRDTLWNVLSAPASAVVSGLPLVTKPMLTRLRLIRDAFTALAPGAPFVQFTYGGGAADSEIAARRVHRGLGADLDEPSAGPRLGVSQGLIPPAFLFARRARFAERMEADVRTQNPDHSRLAAHRLAQCEAGGGRRL
ncbi:phospholipid N-methyltransferase [Bradyrhizobium sp. LM3.4]